MINLPNVTMQFVCTDEPYSAMIAMEINRRNFNFGAIQMFVSEMPVFKPEGVDFIVIPRFPDKSYICNWGTREYPKYLKTDYVLQCQWHGFIMNPKAWTNEFLDYDYIGAPWFWIDDPTKRVGNRGFAISSKKFYEASQEVSKNWSTINPDDANFCRHHKEEMEALGVRYAPESLANKFSVENQPYQGQFGMHEMPQYLYSAKVLEMLYGHNIDFKVER